MRKQELIYLHGLLVRVRDFYETQFGEPVDTEAYDALAISPMAIHRPKSAHKAAVFALARALAAHRVPANHGPPPTERLP